MYALYLVCHACLAPHFMYVPTYFQDSAGQQYLVADRFNTYEECVVAEKETNTDKSKQEILDGHVLTPTTKLEDFAFKCL